MNTRHRNKNLIEDSQLVCEMYSAEQTIYPGLPYVEVVNWCDQLAAGIAPCIEVEKVEGAFKFSPWRDTELNASRDAALDEFKASHQSAYPGPAVRVSRYRSSPSKTLWLTVQHADYFDQVKSNLTVDRKVQVHGVKTSARKALLAEFDGHLPPIDDARMANTLGVAVLLLCRSEDNWIPYLTKRTKNVSLMQGGVHCTASGTAQLGKMPGRLAAFYKDSIFRELRNEVGLDPQDVSMIAPVAFCRELTRGGKPQLFFLGITEISSSEIHRKLYSAREENIRHMHSNPEAHVENEGDPILDWPKNYKSLKGLVNEYGKFKLTMEAAALIYYFMNLQAQNSQSYLSSSIFSRFRAASR